MTPHLGASAKAINNAARKIYDGRMDGNFICNFRVVKDPGRRLELRPSAKKCTDAQEEQGRPLLARCQTFRGGICSWRKISVGFFCVYKV